MRTFSASIDIAASPDAVWAVWQDVARWPEWTASMTSVEVVSGTPLDVGTKVRIVQPRLKPVVMTITDAVLHRRFAWASQQPGLRAFADHVLEPKGQGVRVTLSVAFSGALSTIVGWAFGRLTQRYVEMEAAGLKRRAESLTP